VTTIHLLTSEADQLLGADHSALVSVCEANPNLSLRLTVGTYEGTSGLRRAFPTYLKSELRELFAPRPKPFGFLRRRTPEVVSSVGGQAREG
jgi:hypothetical protein